MIEIDGLRKEYHIKDKSVVALENVSLKVARGEIFGVIGHSGAGKSTLLRCVNMLERPTEGNVKIDGVELTTLSARQLQKERRSIGMIFQHFNLLSSATVFDNIAFPLKLAKRPKHEIAEKVDNLLRLVGLEDHSQKYPVQLSGGQKQRVGIARALANDPNVLLCDEATSALDPQTTQSILQLLLEINRRIGITIVLITHEMHVVRMICDRVAVIDRGRIVEQGPVAEVFLKPATQVTREFIAQVADMNAEMAVMERVRRTGQVENGNQSHKVVVVSFLGESTYKPVLSSVTARHAVLFNILHGTISQMKEVPYGRLLIELNGHIQAVDTVISELRENGLDVEVIE